MRIVILALVLAACAGVPIETPAQLVAGCWADRTATHATLMRWSSGAGAAMHGERLADGPSGAMQGARYSLAPDASGWQLCELAESGQTCWAVARARTGSLEGGRAFIDRYRDRLRVGIVGADGRDRVIFDGQREGCS